MNETKDKTETNPSPSYSVLLIESDPKETEIYSDLIRETANCRVDVMSRFGGSFDWMAKSNYHLVIIDTSSLDNRAMASKRPALNLLERIRQSSPGTSVILISDDADIEEAVAAIRLGAEDYLKKPFNLESFKLAVKRGLDRKAVFGSHVGVAGFLNLLNSCQMVSASLEQSKIFKIVQGYFSQELHSNYSAIYSLDEDNPIRVDEEPQTNGSDRAMEEILEIAIIAASPFRSMQEEDQYYRFIDRGHLTPGLFVFRFQCAGTGDYFCICLSPKKPANEGAFENRIQLLKRQIEVTGNNIKQYLGVHYLAYVDDVTGLYNTRYLNYILEREITQARQGNSAFAVLFIDADFFKKVNDSHGHLVGTKLLNELGRHIKKHVRGSDTVFRYGGDEFVAVLSPCDLDTARVVAERIRKSVAEYNFLTNEGVNIRFSVSIGVALFPDHANSKKAIIEIADQAMYSAKKLSRNCVYIMPIKKNANPGLSNAPKEERGSKKDAKKEKAEAAPPLDPSSPAQQAVPHETGVAKKLRAVTSTKKSREAKNA